MTDQPNPAVPPVPWVPFADWGTRVAASLIDSLVSLAGLVVVGVGVVFLALGTPEDGSYGSTGGDTALVAVGVIVMVVGYLLSIAISLWNRVFTMGRTGQSVGKKAMGITLIDERTGRPMGAGMCFVRELAHFLDGAIYIGYLWPLWDRKRQTFADMIVGTVVVEIPKG